MRRLAAAAVGILLGLAVLTPGAAQGNPGTVRVEVRVWQDVGDELDIYVSARPSTGSWRTLGTIPLPLDDGVSSTGQYRYGDIALEVSLANRASPATVEVRVWQDVRDSARIYISARPADGFWRTLGTTRLLLDDGLSSTGRFRFGDISLDVPPPDAAVTTLAGQPGVRGYRDGPGSEARFGRYYEDLGLGLEGDRDGSVVVADRESRAIRRIAPDGTVTTIAGGNGKGVRDGPADEAQFAGPTDVAIAGDGSIYVADSYGHRIRKIAPDGMVTTVAGSGPIYGHPYEDGAWGEFADGPGAEARFAFPHGIAIDDFGDLYVIDQHRRIRRISPSGWVSTFAGGSELGYRDGPAAHARFFSLLAIEIDDEGRIYVIDNRYLPNADPGMAIRAIDTDGTVSTLYRDLPAAHGGALAYPVGLAVAGDGLIYIANTGRHQIVRLTSGGNLRAVAGTGEPGYTDGDLDEALFNLPGALAVSVAGVLVVADEGNNVIRRIALGDNVLGTPGLETAGAEGIPRVRGVTVEVYAGKPGAKFGGVPRFEDGPAAEALFYRPWGMALEPDGSVIVADSGNDAIRRIAPDGTVTTVAGGGGEGLREGACSEALFREPRGVAVDQDGLIYVADTRNHRIRTISGSCVVTTVAGGATDFGTDERDTGGFRDGPAAEARFRSPGALAFDREGNLFIADHINNLIRRLSPDGRVSTIAGPPSGANASVYNPGSRDGHSHAALFALPDGIAVDDEGIVFFTESNSAIALEVPLANRASPATVEVRVWQDVYDSARIYISARPEGGSWRTLGTIPLALDDGLSSSGRFRFGDITLDVPYPEAPVSTVAGSPGVWGYVDGSGLTARFGGGRLEYGKLGLAVERDGGVVVADYYNHAIRRIAPDGTVSTVAGASGRGLQDGPAGTARFRFPADVAVGADGAIYVADSGNDRIRKISPDGIVSTVAGSDRSEGGPGETRDGPALQAVLDNPRKLALDAYGDLYITEHYAVRRLSASGWVSTFAGDNGHGWRDGPRAGAQFQGLRGIAVDDAGNVYLIDDNRGSIHSREAAFTIRKIDTSGMVSTLYQGRYPALGGTLADPDGLAVTGAGVVYIANTGAHQIVRLTPEGEFRGVAGTGEPGHVDGPREHARFHTPQALALAPSGALVVSDQDGRVVRRILPDRGEAEFGDIPFADFEELPRVAGVRVAVFAGRGGQGLVDGPADQATFKLPEQLAFDRHGNLIVADTLNHAIPRVDPDGVVTTIAGGNGMGVLDGPCKDARFDSPVGVAVDDTGMIYVSERGSDLIRRIDASCSVTTVAGAGDRFLAPRTLAFDGEGNLLVADSPYGPLQRLTPDGQVSTIASFHAPKGIAVDSEGVVFLTDGNRTIHRIDRSGNVATVVSTPSHRYGGAFSAFLSAIGVGPDGELYVVDGGYSRVLRVTRDGVISIVADEGIDPTSLVVAPDGALFVSDSRSVIVKITFEDEQDEEAP